MKVILAKSAGFCFGVKRAVDTVYDQIREKGPIYTYGPIVHNKEVVGDLEKKGVRVITSPEEAASLTEGVLILRAHGVSREVMETIRGNQRIRCVDATCPFVKRIHDLVAEESAKGKHIIIIGNAGHPEVIGTMGWSCTPVTVIENEEEAERFEADPSTELFIVAQTTFRANKFEDLVARIRKKGYTTLCMNTICNATNERQAEAREIAGKADVMIVIGDLSSSNSAKLFEICQKECKRTFFIQTRDDLHLNLTGEEKVIGITAGASTPKNIIEEVQVHVGSGNEF